MYGPQTYEVDKLNVYNCTADEEYSSGKLEIYWQVIDEKGDVLEFNDIATHNHENGLVSAIEFTGRDDNIIFSQNFKIILPKSVFIKCYVHPSVLPSINIH